MFTRVLLNITKHKVLNVLLVFLFILSFVGMAFSSVFVYKTSSYLDTVEESSDFIYIGSNEVLTGNNYDYSFSNVDMDVYNDIYNNVLKEKSDIDLTVAAAPMNMVIEEFDSTDFTGNNEDYVHIEYNYEYISYEYELAEGYDKNKVYVLESVLEKYGLNVGDELTYSAMGDINFSEGNQEVDYDEVTKIEIGGILEPNSELKEQMELEEFEEQMIVYFPGEIIYKLNDSRIMLYDTTFIVKGEDAVIKDLFEEVKDYSNDAYIYYSKDVEASDFEFFIKIRNFFVIIFVSTIVVFAFAMLSLNNNIMERRSDEFRLYNVFGLGSPAILSQLIIEKLILYFMSLIISIPLFLYVLRVGNNIVDKLVSYSIANEMLYLNLLSMSGNMESIDHIYNGISAVDVNRLIVILLVLFIMICIIGVVVSIQFMIKRNSIVNQRRGE